MKNIILRVVECLGALLPFLKKKDVQELRAFSDMVSDQLDFLVEELRKVLSSYFDLQEKMKEMHDEVLSLRKQLQEAFKLPMVVTAPQV